MKNHILIALLLLMLSTSAFAQDKTSFTKDDLRETSIQTVKLFQQKKYAEALPSAEKAALIARQIYGEKNIETANALKNLGYVQFYKGDGNEAEKTLEKVFDIYQDLQNLSEQDKSSAAGIAETVASIKSQKDLMFAEKYYQQAIVWRQEGDGKDSIKLINPLIGLANINYWQRNYKQSSEYYEKALEIAAKNSAFDETNLFALYLKSECAFKKAKKDKQFEIIKDKLDLSSRLSLNAKKDPQKPFSINAGVVNGKALNLAAPAYPAEAKAARATGAVNVQVFIDEEGNVIAACSSSKDANSFLVESSEAAAYNSKFRPTTLNGQSVKVIGTIVYNYTR